MKIPLFQSKLEPTIVCAVLATASLPFSLDPRAWRPVEAIDDIVEEQLEFDRRSAGRVLERNGFYIFVRADE